MIYDKKNLICLAEFLLILSVFVLPPIVSARNFTLPEPPEPLLLNVVFILKIICAAVYEELLYRVYLPFRLQSFYTQKAVPFNRSFLLSELPPVLFFALAHRYLGLFNVLYAFAAGCIFRLVYKRLRIKHHFRVCAAFISALHSAHNLTMHYCR